MATFFDYDAVTGITHYFDHDDATNLSSITSVQDVEPLLEHTRAMANSNLSDDGIKRGFWLYAKIPPIVQVKLRAKGINLHDADQTKRIMQEINEFYPALKVTQKNHDGMAPKLYVPK